MTKKEIDSLLERLRTKLHEVLREAGGDQLDPKVQSVSREFDSVLNIYYRAYAQMSATEEED